MGRLKLFDYECTECGRKREAFLSVPPGASPQSQRGLECSDCAGFTIHDRLISAPSQYLGERQFNPMIHGGRWDTMGARELPTLPDLPGESAHIERASRAAAALPADLTRHERAHELRKIVGSASDAPTTSDYAAHFATSEYREAKAARDRVRAENAEKRKRATALARGENINFRRDRCKGDAAVTG